MKENFEHKINCYLEAIKLLEKAIYPVDDELKIIERFTNYGISDTKTKKLFYNYQIFKKTTLEEININQILNSNPGISNLFKHFNSSHPLIYQFSNLFDYKKINSEIKFNEYLQKFIIFICLNLRGEKDDDELIVPSMQTMIQIINHLPVDSEIKLLLIEFYTLSYDQYLNLVNVIEEVSLIVNKHLYLLSTEITMVLEQLENKEVFRKLLSTVFPSTNLDELITKELSVNVCLFNYNTLSINILDEKYQKFFGDTINQSSLLVGFLFFRLSNLKQEEYLEHLKMINIFKSLGDPTRFRIIQLLNEDMRYPQELARLLSLTPATLNHHLEVLKSADLVEVLLKVVDEKRIYYKLNRKQLELISNYLNQFSHERKS